MEKAINQSDEDEEGAHIIGVCINERTIEHSKHLGRHFNQISKGYIVFLWHKKSKAST